jgi:RimJ/RimL family protein N-acetyltransferase
MKLKPIDNSDLLNLVAGWTSQKENYQWLDFGDGKQILSPAWLKIMTQRPTEVVRVFTSDTDDVPIGVVGLTEVNRHFKTARLWGLVGDKSFRVRGYGTRAASSIVSYGFEELGLHAVDTWVVEGNPSLKLIQRVGFTFIGRQRQCHYIDGRPLDRLWFDLLATEHKKILHGNADTPAESPGEILPGAAPDRNSVR